MPAPLELRLHRTVLVQLAVLHHGDRAVLVVHRLVAACEVDDRQAPRGERDRPLGEDALAVGPAVHERAGHRAHGALVHRSAVEGEHAADPAHGYVRRIAATSPAPRWSTRNAVATISRR